MTAAYIVAAAAAAAVMADAPYLDGMFIEEVPRCVVLFVLCVRLIIIYFYLPRYFFFFFLVTIAKSVHPLRDIGLRDTWIHGYVARAGI